MRIDRIWAMPSRATFTIRPIRELLTEYHVGDGWLDPFAGDHSPAQQTNDIDEDTAALVHREAVDFLADAPTALAEGILLDPPYSLRQRHECYKGVRQVAITPVLDHAARIVRLGGVAISCGWNSNGLGWRRGFAIERVLLVAHGAQHNDTIVTVERKQCVRGAGGGR